MKQHECQYAKGGIYVGQLMEVKCYPMTVPECNGGNGTARSGVGILRTNVKGYDWRMQL
jgi:hypothetical protein